MYCFGGEQMSFDDSSTDQRMNALVLFLLYRFLLLCVQPLIDSRPSPNQLEFLSVFDTLTTHTNEFLQRRSQQNKVPTNCNSAVAVLPYLHDIILSSHQPLCYGNNTHKEFSERSTEHSMQTSVQQSNQMSHANDTINRMTRFLYETYCTNCHNKNNLLLLLFFNRFYEIDSTYFWKRPFALFEWFWGQVIEIGCWVL